MPGTGHSSRYKGSISNRNSKPAFQVLAPWNSKKNGNINQVPVSSGGDAVNFKLMNAKMMSNYNKNTDEFTFDCSLNVLGNKVVSGKVICKDDVDILGNLNIDGVLTAQTALIQDLSAINITDVCDNVLTLGNHESFSTQHMRGIFMSHIGNTFNDEFSFMGFDPCGNDCAGIVNDSHGQFVFLTDASFNSQALDGSCNITGEAGRVLVGTLDISGSTRYGNGGTGSGAPTNGVTGQADSSMHLVGRTIIAQKGTNSAQLDISGGINVVGPSKLTDLSGAYIDISGGNVDIDSSAAPGGDIRIITNTGTDQKIVIDNKQGAASDSVSIKSEAGGIDIIAFTTVDINGSGALALNGGNVTINGSGDLALNGDDVTINGSGDLALNGVDVTINGSGVLACCASSDVLVDAAFGTLDLTAGQDVNIAGGQVALVSKDDAASAISLTTNVGSTETITVTNTQGTSENAITLKADLGGVNIDAYGNSKFTTSTGTLNLTAEQDTSDNAITLKAALGGVNIDAYGNSNFTTSTGTLNLTANIQDVAIEAVVGNVDILALGGIATLTGTGVAITSTANNVVITGAANVDISAANVDINAGTSSTWKTTGGALTLDGAAGVDIESNGSPISINGATGTSGQVLTSFGSGEPLWADPAGYPIGVIMMWTASNTAPTNWQICDGSPAQTNALANLLGGAGTVPNMQQHFPMGFQTGSTTTLGNNAGSNTISVAQLPVHSHAYTASLQPGSSTVSGGTLPGNSGNASYPSGNAGNNEPYLPKYTSVHFIIYAGPGP